MYEEYTTPKVKFNITGRDVLTFFGWFLGAAVALAIVFGIVVAVLETNTETINKKLDSDCLVITYEDNYAFKPDRDLSGIYCKEDVDSKTH